MGIYWEGARETIIMREHLKLGRGQGKLLGGSKGNYRKGNYRRVQGKLLGGSNGNYREGERETIGREH